MPVISPLVWATAFYPSAMLTPPYLYRMHDSGVLLLREILLTSMAVWAGVREGSLHDCALPRGRR